MNFLARSKIFDPDEGEELVHERAPWFLVLMTGKLQDLTTSWSKLFKGFLLLKCYTTISLPTTTILNIFGKK